MLKLISIKQQNLNLRFSINQSQKLYPLTSNKNIKLFASCISVKGANRSIICDLQRNSYVFIPNDIHDVLEIHDGKKLNEVKEFYDNQCDEILDEYFDFLLKNEFVFFTDYPELFPKMSLEWREPLEINNAIIDISDSLDLEIIFEQLGSLHCKSVEIRSFSIIDIGLIEKIMTLLNTNKSIITSIGFVGTQSNVINQSLLETLIFEHPRISYFIICNSHENKFIPPLEHKRGNIYYVTENVSLSTQCGLISKGSFAVNTRLFTESQNHNTCLNRKISIDKDGNIKNCPSMSQSFGNIKDTTLEEALNHPDFKKYWNITKDQIEVCKDCEFRHICTDCRAYIEEPDNQYSKPLKCGYNPYTNVWEEWSTNPLKQKAIEYYGMQELVKKN